MESLLYDLRYGARSLWKSKGLSFIAAISLAAGIGANSAIFTIVDSLLLRPRAVSAPEQLVELYSGDRASPYQTTSYPSYVDFRERNGVFTDLAAYSIGWPFRLGVAGEVDRVWGEAVSGNLFSVLGVRPSLGRTFLPEEDQVPGRYPVAIIGHSLWQRRFGADSSLIGKKVTINNHPMTVVGILPPQFNGMTTGWASEIWVPLMATPLVDPSLGDRRLWHRGNSWLTLVGRLKPDATLEQARARFALLTKEMQREQPDEWMRGNGDEVREKFVSVLPERETRVHPTLRPVGVALAAMLFVIVDLVLLIACLNLASLLLARAVSRRSEVAIRMALGAGRLRIVRQLLAESILLSLVAGVAGVALSLWALDALLAFLPAMPEGIRVAINLQVDWRVILFGVVFSTITGVLFGLGPALHSSRTSVAGILKDDSGAATGRFRKSRLRTSLVVGQVALSLLLLIGAGLLLRSLEKVRPTRLGFASDNFVVAPLSLDDAPYDRSSSQRFFQQVSEDVAALPGVQSASLVEGMPGGFLSRARASIGIEGYTFGPGEDREIDVNIVGPQYFTDMKVPFVTGRDFGPLDVDGAPCVSVVNEAFAHRYLTGPSQALGRHLVKSSGSTAATPTMCRIVGVIRDNAWQSLQRDVRPFFALALQQSDKRRMTLLVQTSGDPRAVISAVRQTIRTLDAGMPLSGVQTLRDHFNSNALPFRLLGIVMSACGVLALLLASVGIYGTVAYSVAQRQREVGIRIALGAVRRDILVLVVGQGMVLVSAGLAIGLGLGVALTWVLTSMPLGMELLFGVTATDLATFSGVTSLLALVALVACYLPARRASRTDPMVTMRS